MSYKAAYKSYNKNRLFKRVYYLKGDYAHLFGKCRHLRVKKILKHYGIVSQLE